MTNDDSSSTSAMESYFVRKIIYGPNHPHRMEHENHLVMVMAHAYTTVLLVEEKNSAG